MPAPTLRSNAPATTNIRFIRLPLLRSKYEPATVASPSVLPTPQAAYHSACDKISEVMPFLRLADRDPDPFGGSRHVDVVDLVLTPQPLDDRIDHRGTGADRARLAGALDAERIGR